ncbi:type II toxin-antitoxin system death-on-curing family toxin [Methylobacterium sp. Leaf118]|uniref:type II toxin-antitoxin system death-on-curing family toxin n=1 Tax=Methylobacterium sp. Leaf118 TaxID=2876562 RepID=UPI001E36BAE7|nr:Fic family protein [Methylobacterium sp. Leaf118]
MPLWLIAEEVIEINRVLVVAQDEPHLVLSLDGLEGALGRPLNAWLYDGEVDRIVLAVLLAAGIAQSHCFQQGNKRTGFFAALLFIEMNGGDCGAVDTEALGKICEVVMLGDAPADALISALRSKVEF